MPDAVMIAITHPGATRQGKGALPQRRLGLKLVSDLNDLRTFASQSSLDGDLDPKQWQKKSLGQRRGDREADGAALEMPCTVTRTAGSNPALSAECLCMVSHRVARGRKNCFAGFVLR